MAAKPQGLRLRTPRLVLREYTLADVEAIHSLESLPDVVRYQTYEPFTEKRSEDYVADRLADAQDVPRESIELVVMLDRVFIGRVGCHIRTEDGVADMWYSFLPTSHGRGYATEAMEGLIAILRKEAGNGAILPVKSMEIECDPRNEPSWKMAQRLDFKKVKEVEKAMECKGEWVGSVVYMKGLGVGK